MNILTFNNLYFLDTQSDHLEGFLGCAPQSFRMRFAGCATSSSSSVKGPSSSKILSGAERHVCVCVSGQKIMA
jgi:hypothetical protein